MSIIKKFNQFVKENVSLSNSSARIYIDSDEAEMFTTEPALQKLVSDRKVSLLPPELYFEAEDKNTIDILKGYFPDVDFEYDFEDEHYSGEDEETFESDAWNMNSEEEDEEDCGPNHEYEEEDEEDCGPNHEDEENCGPNYQAYEAKKQKWIKDAIKKPGALKKEMDKKEGEKLSASEINSKLKELKGKDKDKSKKGVQGLSKKDLTTFRRLNLAKTLKSVKEHQEHQNYMFFSNLHTIRRLADAILEMDSKEVDKILTDGHGWALDHIATSKDDVEEVFNFLASHCENDCCCEPTHDDTEQQMKSIKGFNTFK